MSDYNTITLGELGKVCMCKRVLKEQTSQKGDVPFYKISTFGDKPDAFISNELFTELKNKYSYPKKGDILISAAGTIGKTVIFNNEPAYFQDSNIVWIDNDESKVLNDYLYYFYQLKPWKQTTSSTIKRLYNDNLKSIEINYPSSLEEQKKQISILKCLDDIITNKNMINSTIENMIKDIYYQWFLRYKIPGYEHSLKYNDILGKEIPENWNVCKLGDICSLKNGINYEKKDLGNKEYSILNVRNISSSSFILNENDFDHIKLSEKLGEKYIIGDNDILIARSGCPGEVRILLNPSNSVIFSGFIITCSPKNKNYKNYISLYIKLYEGSGLTKTGGSILQNVSQETLNKLIVCVPPEEIIEKFNKTIEPFLLLLKNNIDYINELEKLKLFILSGIMKGKIIIK